MTKRYVIEDNMAIVDTGTMTPNGIPTKIFIAEDPVEAIKICKEFNEKDQQIKQLKQEVTYRKEQFDVYQQKVVRTLEKEYNLIEKKEHIPNSEKIFAKLEIEKLKEELRNS